MFGEEFRCTKCDFEFCSGWSHHTGGQHLVCRHCGEQFFLGGGESRWQPRSGELLQLFPQNGEGSIPVGSKIEVRLPDAAPGEKDGVAYLEIPALKCPRCNNTDALVQRLQENILCPTCNLGTIIRCGSCIY